MHHVKNTVTCAAMSLHVHWLPVTSTRSHSLIANGKLEVNLPSPPEACVWCTGGCDHLSEEPVKLHAFGGRVAALDETRSAVHIHQALVVVVVDGGAEEAHVKPLRIGVVHVLQQTEREQRY